MDGDRRRSRHSGRHRVYLARPHKSLLWRACARGRRARSSDAAHHIAGKMRRRPAAGHHACGWSLSAPADRPDPPQPQLAAVPGPAHRSVAMNVVSYSELLRLTWPEIAVALAGLLALTLDLSLLRRSAA